MKPDDLSDLEVLDENTIVQALRTRFNKEKFYTYIGDILVAVNPCKPLNLFDLKYHGEYENLVSRTQKAPHLFWTADNAYRSLCETGRNQCILVSGESGAGKTESTKYMIQHLMKISPSDDSLLLDKIVQINPLLEAFGNAATFMNKNSSRFGKFIELHYSEYGQLLGAKIDDYILEKSRVVHRSNGEKNFHVFYALFAGMSRERLLYYFLEDPDCHRIMREDDVQRGVFQDAEEYQHYKSMFSDLTVIMSHIGFSDEHIQVIFLILAAILHLANIVFMPIDSTDGVSVADEYPLHAVAKLLGIEDEVELTEALISNVNTIKGEKIQSWKSLREANDSRDALAKDLYSRLFGWIVGQINRNIWGKRQNKNKMTRGSSIGLLDMSGFENFKVNGFDQLLINISNEKLQQYFMDYIFPRERREYELEGIEWRDIVYHCNDEVLEVLFKRPDGVLSLLDEESHFPQSNDSSLVQKLNKYCHDSTRYVAQMGNRVCFGIRHYAEQVTYNADGFLEGNRDSLSSDLVGCLLNSNNEFIKDLFTASMSPTGTISDFASKCASRPRLPSVWPSTINPEKLRVSLSGKASIRIKKKSFRNLSGESSGSTLYARSSPTVTKHFKRSLSDLMTKLSQAQPLFVRCVKPNLHLSSGKFDSDLVRRQLLCNGLMEIAELRRDGYPIRIKFEDFAARYKDICDFGNTNSDDLGKCLDILKTERIEGFKVGRSKIFLKDYQKDMLEDTLREALRQKELERRRKAEEEMLQAMREISDVDKHRQSTPLHGSADSGLVEDTDIYSQELHEMEHRIPIVDVDLSRDLESTADTIDIGDSVSVPKRSVYQGSADDGKSTNTTFIDQEVDSMQWRPYDIFQVAEREFEDQDYIFKEILKGIRLFLYVFFVIMILGSIVASKMSLLLLTSGINKDENSRGEHLVTLLFCMCGPMLWNWFMAFMRILFGGKEWPSMKTFLILLLFENVQTFGMCLLLFRVLPSTDFFRGLITTFAICQVPSLLKVIVHEKRPNPSVSEIVAIIMNISAFLVQVSAIPFFSIGEFMLQGNYSIVEGYNATTVTRTTVKLDSTCEWELPVSLILLSIGWWENYVSGEWTVFGRITIPFKQWRSILQDVRETSYFLIAPFKIGLAVLMARLLTNNTPFVVPATGEFNATTSQYSSKAEEVGVAYSLMFIQIGSGIICSYLAGLACKLHMQRTAFALPLTLAPPVSLLFVYMQCEYNFLPSYWHMGGWFCPERDIISLLIPLICAVLLWLSYSITVSHIWFPQSERMAKIEKLFITPHTDGILPDFTLSLRRRRNDKEVKLTGFDTFRYVGEDTYYMDDIYSSSGVTPQVYACATMWHETRQEMTQLLKSLFRLDYVHCASRLAQEKFRIHDPDYYDLELHIIFDDAFELDDKVDKYVPNSFVRQLIECMEDAARSVVKGPISIQPPEKIPTPYGGRLVWTMPGHTKLNVHMKDKNKMRHRKRWSQCMYLYYLLGYKLFGAREADRYMAEDAESSMTKVKNRKKSKSKKCQRSRPLRSLFMRMTPDQYEQAENTFMLTLDGDVDFRPDSVKLLIDRMKKNKKVGAVCGRIHPIGSGPMVWYQQFEYAVGHWLQKAAEHVFGCVLCCPGCFSLFRGSAIMDDNVLKMYTTKPTEARHYIQFEQGEDRWLCTLMLQQGHRIDYCAGADALTFAPETFNEFFNQRRRWSPSTLANMMDLLSSWRDTVRINDNISRPYVLYQFVLMASTILGPSTIILMITGSYHSVLGLNIWQSYLLSILPVMVYLAICMTMKSDHQIFAAAVITAIYSVVMMIATVGTIISIVTENFGSPNVVFLSGLVIIFVIAGILHPQEFFCLIYGVLYFMTVPSTFVLLTVYYLCNLNNVSWGTRETPKKLTKEEEEELKLLQEEKKKKKESKSLFNRLGITSLISDARDLLKNILGTARNNERNMVSCAVQTEDTISPPERQLSRHSRRSEENERQKEPEDVVPQGWEPNPDHPYWLTMECFGNGPVSHIEHDEIDFWNFMIKKYLHPLDEDQQHKQKIKEDLICLKNNVVFIYFMINFLWTIITLQLQSMEDELKNFYIINKYEPLSLVFLSVFAIAITLQFLSMFIHRWGTFLHLMSSTRIDWFKKVHTEEDFVRFVVNEAQRLQRLEPEPDYDDLPPDYDDDGFTSSIETPSEQYDELPSLPASPGATCRKISRSKSHKERSKNNFNKNVPVLQQIFENRLENIHRKWKQGTLAFRPNYRFDRTESHRFSEKEHIMRQKMFKRSFRRINSKEDNKNHSDDFLDHRDMPQSIKIDMH
uniref:chitin synthase n=1 Tax=Atrina rigida TaxID=61340 RepID=Q288C6_ATRRI|nr:chitin synthase [Atrina rigida]